MRGVTFTSLIVGLLLLASCGGDGGEGGGAPTPGASPAATSTSSAETRVIPPARPSVLTDYPRAAEQFLTASTPARSACIALHAAWAMPRLAADDACRTSNVDDDEPDELIAVFSAEDGRGGVEYQVAVFDAAAGGSLGNAWLSEAARALTIPEPIAPVIAAGNITSADAGGGALAYETTVCEGVTCDVRVRVIKGGAGGYHEVTPPGGVLAGPGTVRFEDIAGDGARELLVPAAATSSPDGGPVRGATAVYTWNGALYALGETISGAPTFLYHAVRDADDLFARADYGAAADAYLAATENPTLLVWMDAAKNERAELTAYALYRAGVARVATGDTAEGIVLLDRGIAMQGTLHAQLAGAFKAGYEVRGDDTVACSAVNENISRNLAEYAAFWDFGSMNPPFDPGSICPL